MYEVPMVFHSGCSRRVVCKYTGGERHGVGNCVSCAVVSDCCMRICLHKLICCLRAAADYGRHGNREHASNIYEEFALVLGQTPGDFHPLPRIHPI